jgi:adenylate cyclase
MEMEIEHKYLVNAELWNTIDPEKSYDIKQGYLSIDPNKTIRVRTKGDKGFITIKGRANGAMRPEFEYEIPLSDANELIQLFCKEVVEKVRHQVTYNNKIWEVDEFKGLNKGLLIAEIELKSKDEKYEKPDWITKEITEDLKYANAYLSIRPFSTW